jgi:hypothetical protein
MEFNRRLGQGTLSEVLGEATLHIDKFSRLLGLYNRSISDLNFLSQQVTDLINAYIQVYIVHSEANNILQSHYHKNYISIENFTDNTMSNLLFVLRVSTAI